MPTTPLLDICAVDLSQTAIPGADLDCLLPQCGEMRQINRVVSYDLESKLSVGVKDVTDDEFWVPGHVPGRPILPGVLMIEAAAQLASIYYAVRARAEGWTSPPFLGFTRVDDTSFRGMIVPGQQFVVVTKEIKFSRRRFMSLAQGFVNNGLAFETRITGMAM